MPLTNADLNSWAAIATAFGVKAMGAIVVWFIGRWLIGFGTRLLKGVLEREKFDPTLTRYLVSVIVVTLNIVLVVAILGYFGVETTSFAALLAGLGIAIGSAWGGLLGNLAAGVFIVILRPFKVGDYILAAGVEGTVREIGLFATSILTPDNVDTLVGNTKLFNDNIKNYSLNPYRRVDLVAQIGHGVDPRDAAARLRPVLAAIPNVMTTPAPDIEIFSFNERGTLLAVRPYCATEHFWQVYFDTNRAIAETFSAAGYPVPEAHLRTRTT